MNIANWKLSLFHRCAIGATLSVAAACGSAEPSSSEPETESDSDELCAGTRFGDPMPGLSADERARFAEGAEVFSEAETPAEGLGPVFNDTSCAACHVQGAVGGGGERLVTRFGAVAGAKFDALDALGGSLIQEKGIGVVGACDYVGEVVPKAATVHAGRRTTPLFGLGLVDAVPDATFVALAAHERKVSPDTAGVVSIVPNVATGRQSVGKFGWKAQNPSLFVFSADAYLNEMGITSPLFPKENCPQGNCDLLACNPFPGLNDDGDDVVRFADFMAFLAPPPRDARARETSEGAKAFEAIGCASCHTPSLSTGTSKVKALSRVRFHPYSDFLLHDMGSLGDGISQNTATGAQMRTAPLWGIRAATTLLHDGRAKSIAEAILAHDGQGRAARDRFAGLSTDRRDRLVAFVRSL